MSALSTEDITVTNPTFASLGVPAPLVAVLAKQGITVPFPIQAATLPDALDGRDILGRAQTGSGKTLGFSLPLVARLADGHTMACRPRGLILVPTRELAAQVHAVLTPLAHASGPQGRHHLRRDVAEPAGRSAPQPGRHRRRVPGQAGRPDRAGPLPARRRGHHRPRRGRPHGRPRLPPGRPAAARHDPGRRPADAVLRDPRRRRSTSSPAGSCTARPGTRSTPTPSRRRSPTTC